MQKKHKVSASGVQSPDALLKDIKNKNNKKKCKSKGKKRKNQKE